MTLLIIAYESTYKTFSTRNRPTDAAFGDANTLRKYKRAIAPLDTGGRGALLAPRE